jgi:CSLREA domain-containing protein
MFSRFVVWSALVLLASASAVEPAAAATFVVNSLADSGSGGCTTTQCTLRDAIAAANGNAGADTITIGVTGTINLASELPAITDSLSVIGPGAAQLTVRRDSGGDYRIFTLALQTPGTVNFSGLTISNGSAILLGDCGGGDCGGGIVNLSTDTVSLNVTDCAISGNAAANGAGGGIGAFNNFSGIHGTTGPISVVNSTVSGNTAFGCAAIWSFGGAIAITHSTVSNNTAGAFCNDVPGTLTIVDSTIAGNTGWDAGGAVFNNGALTIRNSTLSGNSSTNNGGAISTGIGTTTIVNSTLTGNSTAVAGGAIFSFGPLNITNATIAGNHSATDAGGIYNFGATAPLVLTSSIVALNTADRVVPDLWVTVASQGYNVIGAENTILGTTTATDQIGVTADQLQLMPLADNGGPTQTMALGSGSVAIDHGINAASLTTDQRGTGFVRTCDDPSIINAVAGDGTDAGAFETQSGCSSTPPVVTEVDDVITAVSTAGLTSTGIRTSLTAKLQAALEALQTGGTAPVCSGLQDFINEVRAQQGKKISVALATSLIASATQIMTQLGCL